MHCAVDDFSFFFHVFMNLYVGSSPNASGLLCASGCYIKSVIIKMESLLIRHVQEPSDLLRRTDMCDGTRLCRGTIAAA
jgi:hypothetical protein